jgi:phosphatidylserine/phosphatidylglycerophosphate/cardiolipin synthase-like enzyme
VKAIVVDGAAAYAGSENLSYTSLSKNREVGAIFDEPANDAAMQATFATDWASATPF